MEIDYDTLVLSGGSVRILIMLGALQYVTDNFLLDNVHKYVGTSAGAMVCFLLAIGYTPSEIMVYICTHHLIEHYTSTSLNFYSMIDGNGAASYASIYAWLEKITIAKIGYIPTFKELHDRYKATLICITYNKTKKRRENISYENYPNLPCLIGIKMSSNLPFLFEDFLYGGDLFIDGGLVDNFPIKVGESIGERVLGMYLVENEKSLNKADADYNILEYIYDLFFIPVGHLVAEQLEHVDKDKCTIVELKIVDNVTSFSFNLSSIQKLNLFSSGYQQIKHK